jgi:hypothetical protein
MRVLKKNSLLFGFVCVAGILGAVQDVSADEADRVYKNAFSLESNFRKNDSFKLRIPIEEKDVELKIGGSIKVDSYKVRNGVRLNKKVDDQVNQWRQRIKLGLQSNFGKNEHNGVPVAESSLIVGSTLFWRSILTKDYGVNDVPNSQDFINPPVSVFVDEAWFKFNLETLTPIFETMPSSFTVGYFPYCVGRGLSLGDRSYGGVTYMGFPRQAVQTSMPKYAPGILFHGEIPSHHLSYDIYYSPMVSENVSKYVQSVSRHAHIPNKDDSGAHGRHLFSLSMAYLTEPTANSSVRIEPYAIYYNSQRQTVESPSDSPLYLTSIGAMLDLSVGPVLCNIEGATQFGRQDVLPWIDSRTTVTEYHPGYKVKLSGSMFVFDLAYQVQDYPVVPSVSLGYFSGGDYPYSDTVGQYHAQEGGFATLLQAQQATDGRKDREFKGFLPLRDWGYRGMWCNPLVMFSSGVVPRPVDIDLNALTTFNDSDCATNLIYMGVGATCNPLAEKEKLSVSGALFFYGEVRPPLKWSMSEVQPGFNTDLDSVSAVSSSLGFSGWHTTERASSFLGVELSAVINYKVAKDCQLSVRGGAFLPGTLYAHVAGQPNINSTVVKNTFVPGANGIPSQSAVITNSGLGRDPAYGLYVRMAYDF